MKKRFHFKFRTLDELIRLKVYCECRLSAVQDKRFEKFYNEILNLLEERILYKL